MEYIREWINSKINNDYTAEYTDFVHKLIFPIIKKENANIDDLHLMLFAHEIANDSYFMKGIEPKPINKFRVVQTFFNHKQPKVKNKLYNLIPEIRELYEEYSKEVQGVNKIPKFFN